MLQWLDEHALWVVLALIALMMLPLVVFAQQTTYTYLGQPFTTPAGGVIQVTGEVVTANPLTDGTQLVTPISWEFNGSAVLNSSFIGYPNPIGPMFVFQVNKGVIIGWLVQVRDTAADVDIFLTLSSDEAFGADRYIEDHWNCNPSPPPCNPVIYTGVSTLPGVWADPTNPVPVSSPPPPVDPLQAQLDTANQMISTLQGEMATANARIFALEKEDNQLYAEELYLNRLLARK